MIDKSELSALLKKALGENDIALDSNAQEKLIDYLLLLQKWNRHFNLTTILAPREMVYLHLIDSLSILPHLNGHRMLDVGSGAGLPGIPLAIANPQHEWTLLDKNGKKVRFLRQAIAELGLKNIEAQHSRVEEFHPATGFDTILSRAFGSIRLFSETAEHLLANNGILLAMKGKYPKAELEALPSNVSIEKSIELAIQGINIERHLICLRRNS